MAIAVTTNESKGMIEFVAGFMFTPDKDKVALVCKNRPSWQKGSLNGIGGKVEAFDASTVAAVCREFEEEAGVKTTPEEWQHFARLEVVGLGYVNFFRAFSDKVHKIHACTDEEVGLYETQNLPANLISNLKWLIPMSMDENLLLDNIPVFTEQTAQKTA